MLLQRKPPNPGDHLGRCRPLRSSFLSPRHSHQLSVHDAPRALSAVVFHTAIAMAERRDKGLVKKRLKDHQDKLEDLDTRLSRVEAIQERQEGYRRLRVEKSPDLASLWASVENKGVSASELHPRRSISGKSTGTVGREAWSAHKSGSWCSC